MNHQNLHTLVTDINRAMEGETLLHRLYEAIGPYEVRRLLANGGLTVLIQDLELFMNFDDSE